MVRISSSASGAGRRRLPPINPRTVAVGLIIVSLVLTVFGYARILWGVPALAVFTNDSVARWRGGGGIGGGPVRPPMIGAGGRKVKDGGDSASSASLGAASAVFRPAASTGRGFGRGGVRAIVGYAVSITGCGSDPLLDGAAVLAHSVRLSSASNPSSGSRYGFKMYAIVHTSAEGCAPLSGLRSLGYEVMIVDVPVPVAEIRGEFLRTRVVDNGCCGEKEFVKLEAYALTEHPIVVHLDLDTLILRPMDELFDIMTDGVPPGAADASLRAARGLAPKTGDEARGGVPTHAGAPLPRSGRVDAYFTRDYNMVRPGRPHVGVQGGFLVLRPSRSAYEEFTSIIREGNFQPGSGWGGKGFGPFYGSMTFQGIVPYYYDELHPGTAVELDRCAYNQMCDNPRDQRTVDDVVHGNCRDGREDCPDCRSRPLEEVRTAHFTLCQKPWWCIPHNEDRIQDRLCRKLHGEWFRIREDWERVRSGGREEDGSGRGEGTFQPEHFRGYCTSRGKNGYVPVEVP